MPPSLVCRNLPVYTKTGQHLGRVVDVEVEANGIQVMYYHVAPSVPLVGELWQKRLLISPRQVVSLTPEKMVVDDSVATATSVAHGLAPELS